MTKYTKNWCYGNMINIQCANCKYRIGYWCFEKEIQNGDLKWSTKNKY